MLKLDVRELLGDLQGRVHVPEARRKDDLVALAGQISDHAFGIGHRRDVFDVLRLDLVAEFLLNLLAGLIVLLGPAVAADRARIDPGGLQGRGRAGGGRRLSLLCGLGRIVPAAGQKHAGGGGKGQSDFAKCHYGYLIDEKKGEKLSTVPLIVS